MKKFTTIPVLVALVLGGFAGAAITKPQTEPVEMDHSKMEKEMSMDDMMKNMMKNLEGKTGSELDEAFLRDMIPHHQGAVEMAEALLAGTEKEEMKEFANDIIDAQSEEINMMNQWLERITWR